MEEVDDHTPPGLRRAYRVLERLAVEHLEPYPANFTLWYSYYADSLPDMTRAINLVSKSGQPWTQLRCDELFQRFFSAEAEVEAIREAGDRTQGALHKLLEVLDAATVGDGRYSTALGGFRAELEETLDVGHLRAAITTIARETRAIADDHERLRRRLTETGSELNHLRARLSDARRELMIDGLTGIANRKGFEAALAAATGPDTQPLSLLMIDLDNFKVFNDRHGHLVGDMVLRLVARVLTECIKGRDTVARFGGEEFSVILPKTALVEAMLVADHIRVTVGSKQIINRNRNENFGMISLSAGVTQYVPGESLNDAIGRADAALYVAKRSGRNRVCQQAAEASVCLT